MNMDEKVYQCMRKEGVPCSDRRTTDMSNEELRELIVRAQKQGVKEAFDDILRKIEKVTFRAVLTVTSALITYGIFKAALLVGVINIPGKTN